MTSVDDRVDYLVTQYIWALENDSEAVPGLKEKVRDGHFRDFSVAVRTAILPIRKLLGEPNRPDDLLVWELAYIYLETWFRLGGYGKALTTQSGNRVWQESVMSINTVGLHYTDRGVRTLPQPTTNPCAEVLISQPQPCVLAEPEKEIPVSKKIIIANVTFINNVDVTTMNDAQLIDAIRTIENEINDLKAIKAKSVKIAAKILDAQLTLNKVVEILDGRS
jgi:hypothetical protein